MFHVINYVLCELAERDHELFINKFVSKRICDRVSLIASISYSPPIHQRNPSCLCAAAFSLGKYAWREEWGWREGRGGGEGGGRREEGLETLLLGLKAKTNSGRHGGCAIQSWCNGIPRTSGNWDDASRTKVNGFGSARNAMKFRVSPWRWKYREIVDRAGQHPRNVARYPNAVRNAGMAAPVIAA